MRVLYLTHSLVSCWNHGNAHFLRGVLRELEARGHETLALEPEGGWSRTHLRADAPGAEARFARTFPELTARTYSRPEEAVAAAQDADLVVVHEWNEPALVAALGRARAAGGRFALLFHDTHHRAVSNPAAMGRYDLSAYDGVLAFGEAVREVYRARGWGRRAWVWHEAADIRLFRPLPRAAEADVAWIGNWGDDERTAELEEYLFGPVERLGLSLTVHGVRYPAAARARLAGLGAEYRGWLPNAEAPEVFARHRVTVHVPRRFYAESLPGIPTIRPFEAMACAIPLISAPWEDSEGLFREGDFLRVRSGREAEEALRRVLAEPALAAALARSGLETIRARHTCGHRADELLAVAEELRGVPA
ncbi:spore maturation protein CgeB [Hasllibacter halocynthiae]|uniref:Spore maturation protein CgeB n=1 Tax=Hasllibacter halocynthiae TaxID=595589 RepID=A0A2T0X980_9RHOB|nr:glycosyltransferase [Hasllibacter halocynthiae]PRY95465.1 spore maturation protein CgeB [Hasllibacter halocynthiae]